MTVSFECSTADRARVSAIVTKALELNPDLDRLSTEMDLIACHANGCPLDFEKLEGFDSFNLMHDVYGIARHLDRHTGQLGGFFSPRCHAQALPTKYVYQDGADFYQEFAETDSSEHLWTAPFKVGMDSALAEKARAEFMVWAKMNAFKAVF